MAITNITIYRRSVNLWEMVDNTGPLAKSSDSYRGTSIEGMVTITRATGTPIYSGVSWEAFEYVDEYGSESFTPSSARDLMQRLLDEGFFLGSSAGGGAGATAFLELTDVAIPNYFGRDGQVIYIDGGVLKSKAVAPLIAPDLQAVTGAGALTNIAIQVGTLTDYISYQANRIVRKISGFQTRITFDNPTGDYSANIRALDKDEDVAFLSDVTTFGLIVTVADTIQDDRLIGLDITDTDFPFSISADNTTWTEFDSDIFPDMEYDNTTGTITGFLIGVGKKVFLTVIK